MTPHLTLALRLAHAAAANLSPEPAAPAAAPSVLSPEPAAPEPRSAPSNLSPEPATRAAQPASSNLSPEPAAPAAAPSDLSPETAAPGPAPSDLSPEAAAHNDRASAHYAAGRLDEALAELTAAYAAMPDPRAHAVGRDKLLGSMRGLLLEQHDRTRDPAPLCDLRARIARHRDELAAASPDVPPPELAVLADHLRDVDGKLAAYPANACDRSTPPPPSAPPATAPAPRAPRPSPPPDGPTPRQLRIAGAVTLGLGAAALGVMAAGIALEMRHDRQVDHLDQTAAGRPFTAAEHQTLLEYRADARGGRLIAVGTGIAGAALVGGGVGLLLAARRTARDPRWAAAPWWSAAGAGLTVRVALP